VREELGLVKLKREILVFEGPHVRPKSKKHETPEAALFYEKITSELQETLGKPLSSIPVRLCPFCGAENATTARFCTKCNVWLPAQID